MRELIPLATALRDAAGGYPEAMSWTEALLEQGASSFQRLGVRSDVARVLTRKAESVGVLDQRGKADRVQLAKLIVLLDALAALPPAPNVPSAGEPLVFTVPRAAQGLVPISQRLELLVNDVIARAQSTLLIGGPFWNGGGWDLLRPVVLPALESRHVAVTFYLHPRESGARDVVSAMLAEASSHGQVQALWWAGGVPSLMHAKFVVADGTSGYFGTANLTSLGLTEHLELGVALTSTQAESLCKLLKGLESAALFTESRQDLD